MKKRALAGLALAIALGGCTTYGYVDQGGGYYTGETVTRHSGTVIYGSGVHPYYYDYSPGMSYGLRYYTPYRPRYIAPYGTGYYQSPRVYRPPHVLPPRPRPGHEGPPRPRPGHDGPPRRRPGNDSPRPRPPAEGERPQRPGADRPRWRDIDRTPGGQHPRQEQERRRWPGQEPGQGPRQGPRPAPVQGPRQGPGQAPRQGPGPGQRHGPSRPGQPRTGQQGPRAGASGAVMPPGPRGKAAIGQRVEVQRAMPRPVRPEIATRPAPAPESRAPARSSRQSSSRNVNRDTFRP